MAKRVGPNPFEQTSNEQLEVRSGVFTSTGRDMGRTGATNARAATGGFGAKWKSSSQQRRVNLITLLSVLLVVVIVLPMIISFVGANRREAIAAAEAAGVQTANIVVIQPDVQAAADTSKPVIGAYALSATFVTDDTSGEMKNRIDAVSESLVDNNAGTTQRLSDDAVSYFVDTYVPELLSRVDELKGEWSAMNWDTVTEIDSAVIAVQQNLSTDKLTDLSAAVGQLAAALGNARDEHYANRVTYVPPAPPKTQAPKATEEPEETPEPTEEPEETEDPEETPGVIGGGGSGDDDDEPQPTSQPEPTQNSGNGGGGNGGNSGGNGNGGGNR
ncbi:hypothetical protein [Gulosibacter faecalis]|uniref:Uncharacterized protein n=1 Tax=Gulosibacter faecalis TaxID=272240 RepID=A0ABW5UU76_9MICO|nr:hypothetical protein [Gulosibacter faecalis]